MSNLRTIISAWKNNTRGNKIGITAIGKYGNYEQPVITYHYGYSMGGNDLGNYTTIDRIAFPFDSGTASHVGNLSGSRRYAVGCNSSDYGYSLGGLYGGNNTSIDRITFPFDSGTGEGN